MFVLGSDHGSCELGLSSTLKHLISGVSTMTVKCLLSGVVVAASLYIAHLAPQNSSCTQGKTGFSVINFEVWSVSMLGMSANLWYHCRWSGSIIRGGFWVFFPPLKHCPSWLECFACRVAAGTAHGFGLFDYAQKKQVAYRCTLNVGGEYRVWWRMVMTVVVVQ